MWTAIDYSLPDGSEATLYVTALLSGKHEATRYLEPGSSVCFMCYVAPDYVPAGAHIVKFTSPVS